MAPNHGYPAAQTGPTLFEERLMALGAPYEDCHLIEAHAVGRETKNPARDFVVGSGPVRI